MEWPEGKTAAETLRECTGQEEPFVYPLNSLASEILGEGSLLKGSAKETKVFLALADQIEKEIEEAKGSPKGNCIPAPVDENGELWRVGDRVVTNNRGETNITSLSWDGVKWTARCRWGGKDDEISCFIRDCKRPKLEVLDADGVPIEVGDTVFNVKAGFKLFVTELDPDDVWHIRAKRVGTCHEGWFITSVITHREPDTQEKIDADAKIPSYLDYWKCRNIGCSDCPAREDGKTPYERYGNCSIAMTLDLLRRQRELCERECRR